MRLVYTCLEDNSLIRRSIFTKELAGDKGQHIVQADYMST